MACLPVIPASEDQDRGFPEIKVANKISWIILGLMEGPYLSE